MRHVDVLVLGCGGVGSAALYHLAKRGVAAIALEQFVPPHDRGSSHGETRIIRQAYFEHPDYVPLCRLSYELWDELSEEWGAPLRHETGVLQIGPEDGPVVRGVLRSARDHGLAIERLTASHVRQRFPGFHVPEGMCGVFESAGGYLEVENCIRAHVDAATKRGAEVMSGVTVTSWMRDGASVRVDTDQGSFSCDRLIVTAGAWASGLLASLGIPFEVRRKPLFWFENAATEYRVDKECPAFLFELPDGVFYGFPDLGDGRLKVAEHSGGERVDAPLELDRSERDSDRSRMTRFLSVCLPGVSDRVVGHSVCMYTMTPDEHFVVDVHPEFSSVAFAAGLSGHGFKMVPVLGMAVVDLVMDGRTDLPVGFLGTGRFS